jgi:hypothetical protein
MCEQLVIAYALLSGQVCRACISANPHLRRLRHRVRLQFTGGNSQPFYTAEAILVLIKCKYRYFERLRMSAYSPCKHHHRIKQAQGRKLEQPKLGILAWTGRRLSLISCRAR